MLITEQERLKQDIATWSESFGRQRSNLLPILQEVQRKYHCVSDVAMQIVADALGIHPSEVHSVVSFYSFLDERPKGEFVVRLCRTVSCNLAGKERVAQQLRNDLKIQFGETTADGKFTLEWASCLGLCDQGPALLVNDEVYTKITPAGVHHIIESCRRTFGMRARIAKEIRT
jgi:NADH:ubiquinone oxidoreductase subunit E